MTEENQPVKAGWSAVQVYTMSLICLVIGISAGYLFRGSASPKNAEAPAATVATGPVASAAGMGAGAIPPGSAAPSADQMKKMAEKQAAPLLEKLSKDPNDYDTLMKLGGYYFAAQQFDESTKYYERAANLKPSADVFTKLANASFYSGSVDKAVSDLNRALQIDPKFANALYNLGMIKWQAQGDPKGAIECWEKLIKTNPKHPQLDQVRKMIAVVKQHKDMPEGKKAKAPAM